MLVTNLCSPVSVEFPNSLIGTVPSYEAVSVSKLTGEKFEGISCGKVTVPLYFSTLSSSTLYSQTDVFVVLVTVLFLVSLPSIFLVLVVLLLSIVSSI